MINSKYFNLIISLLMLGVVLLTGIAVIKPDILGITPTTTDSAAPEYASQLFVKDEVIEINIDIEESDWNWLVENALQEEYRTADVTINGETYYNVGLRPKGNSSLRTVANSEDTERFSFKIKFDEYIDGQNLYGLEQIALNNMISDTTYMKEYLSYQLFEMMGVPTPLYSFVYININGEPWGLYLMVESDAEAYLDRNFGSDHGILYKPEAGGSDLKWTGEDWSNYSGIRDNAMVDISDSDFQRVITMIENLNQGTDLEKYIDVDTTLRYFAVNTLLVNLDSYAGTTRHNYFLYEEDGVFSILPWDLNMSFGGFQLRDTQEAINFSIASPYMGNAEDFPLISQLLAVPEYRERYYQYLAEAVSLYFDSGLFEETVSSLDNLIGDYVQNDPTAFVTYEEYQDSLPVLIEFGKLRAASVTAQLAGQSFSIDTDLDLTALGSMPGQGGRGGQPGGLRPAQDNREPMAEGMMPGRVNGNNMPGGMMPNGNNRGNRPGEMVPGMPPPLEQNQADFRQDNFPGREMMRPGQTGNKKAPPDSQILIRYGMTAGLYILAAVVGIIFAARFKRRKMVPGTNEK